MVANSISMAPSIINMKNCRECNSILIIGKNITEKVYLNYDYRCKTCTQKYDKKRHTKESNKIWYMKNKEIIINKSKAYYRNNRQRILEYQKLRREETKESRSIYNQLYYKKYRELKIEYIKEYRQTEVGKIVHRNSEHKRRQRIKQTPIELLLTTEQYLKMKERTTHCPYCNVKLNAFSSELDHIVPLDNGGYHSKENSLICCRKCNRSKYNKNLEDWFGLYPEHKINYLEYQLREKYES